MLVLVVWYLNKHTCVYMYITEKGSEMCKLRNELKKQKRKEPWKNTVKTGHGVTSGKQQNNEK